MITNNTYKGKGEILAYRDSDYAGDIQMIEIPRLYNSNGYGIQLVGNRKKSSVVATSTAEVEYIATRECVKKALWIRNIFMGTIQYNKVI